MSTTPYADKLLEMAYELKGMKLGLEEMRKVDASLGSPSRAFKSIHVAGTNGKGSVSTKIASGLLQKGFRVGLYTSPHLFRIYERMKIDGEEILESRLERYLALLMPMHLTYFETLTMAAFLYFAEQKVDYAVVEVGMGGRLDATNIITPELAVITSIGKDHCQYLGNTLEEITREKAGILKPGVKALIGPTVHIPYVHKLEGPFAHFEEENRALAKEALRLLGMEVADLTALPRARFEEREGVIYDVGHNPPALKSLFDRVKLSYPGRKVRVVAGFSADKDVSEMIRFLEREAVALHLTRALHPRALAIGCEDPKRAFQEAQKLAEERGELLVVCGSHFLIKEILYT